jgi:hypothetical protein
MMRVAPMAISAALARRIAHVQILGDAGLGSRKHFGRNHLAASVSVSNAAVWDPPSAAWLRQRPQSGTEIDDNLVLSTLLPPSHRREVQPTQW